MDWTIREITEKTGVCADTLRYYEKEGLIAPKRRENGYRYYDEADVLLLKYIVVMTCARFSLADIKSLVELFDREPSADCNETCKRILKAKIVELKQIISNYRKTISLMEAYLPMVSSFEAYVANEEHMDKFISQVFDDIQSGALFAPDVLSESN